MEQKLGVFWGFMRHVYNSLWDLPKQSILTFSLADLESLNVTAGSTISVATLERPMQTIIRVVNMLLAKMLLICKVSMQARPWDFCYDSRYRQVDGNFLFHNPSSTSQHFAKLIW